MDSGAIMIFQIIFPLLASVICLLLKNNKAWLFSSFALAVNLIIAIINLKSSFEASPIFYHLGGWGANIGIEYRLDKLSAFFIFLVSLMSFANVLATRSIINYEIDESKSSLFYGLMLFSITGLLGIAISNDIFNIYVLLEVNSIASYALVAAKNGKESKKAAFNYLIFGTIGSSFILLGIGFIYAIAGSLNFSIISNSMANIIENKAVIAGILMIILGILMKSALFPFGNYLVNIYQNSPSFVASLLASTSNKIGIYLLLRLYFNVFKLNQFNFEYLEIFLLIFSMIALFTCSIMALKQTNIKRFLAYSSLSQIGFIVLAIALASKTSIVGALFYSFSHSLEKISLFLIVGLVVNLIVNSEEIKDWGGFARVKTWVSILLIINLLSTVGIPFTAGFVGKWEIFKAALESDIWYIMIVAIAMLFTISYVFKFVEVVIFSPVNESSLLTYNKAWSLWIVTILTCLNVVIGIKHEAIMVYLTQISKGLIE